MIIVFLLLLFLIYGGLFLFDVHVTSGGTRYADTFLENVIKPITGFIIILALLYLLTNLFEPNKDKLFNIRERTVESTTLPKEGSARWHKERNKVLKEMNNKDFSKMTPEQRKNAAKKMFYYMTPEQKKKYRERFKK